MRTILLSFSLLMLVSACQNNGGADSAPVQDKFDAAYPEMYSALGLPEYRKGNIQDISGKTEGVKTEHNIVIMAPDSPRGFKRLLYKSTHRIRMAGSKIEKKNLTEHL